MVTFEINDCRRFRKCPLRKMPVIGVAADVIALMPALMVTLMVVNNAE